MEEKNLTDEEVVKALCCLAGQKACDLCKYDDLAMQDEEKTCINLVAEDTLDLIHRLQSENEKLKFGLNSANACLGVQEATIAEQKAEIERLTEEANQDTINHIDLCTQIFVANKQNAELQKQVDKLTEERENMQGEIFNLEQQKEDLYFQNKNLQTYIDNHEPIWKRNTEQAVKDTAKEIYGFVKISFAKVDVMGYIKDRYGVEVE